MAKLDDAKFILTRPEVYSKINDIGIVRSADNRRDYNVPWAMTYFLASLGATVETTPPVVQPDPPATDPVDETPVETPPVETPPETIPPASTGPVVSINGQSALNAAMTAKNAGATLELAAGGYSLKLLGQTFDPPVIITSADPKNPAVITYGKLTDCSGMTFTQIDIGRATTQPDAEFMFKVIGGSDFVFDGVHVHGTLDNDPTNDAFGLVIAADNVKVTNSEFEQLSRAATFGGHNIVVSFNKVHDIRSDGFDFANVHNVLVEGNSFRGFARVAGDHPDAIQFFTNGQAASSDIIIRDNVLICDNGVGSQFVFLRDENGNMPYENVVIENNFGLGTNMANSITLDHAIGKVRVAYNTSISPTDDSNPVWIRMGDIPADAEVVNNIADTYYGGQPAGNYLTTQALSSAQLALLKTSNLSKIKVSDLIVAGKGYQI